MRFDIGRSSTLRQDAAVQRRGSTRSVDVSQDRVVGRRANYMVEPVFVYAAGRTYSGQ